jgi:uncharacterized membrane protein
MNALSLTQRRARPRKGVLTLEWILIITVLVIGVIAGLGLVRKAVVEEMADMAESIQSLQVKTQAELDAEAGP